MKSGTRWSIVVGVAAAMVVAAEAAAQDDSLGVRSLGPTGGYGFAAPRYQLGLTSSSLALESLYTTGYGPTRGYGLVGGSPAYLYSAPVPRFNYIPLRYQTGYRYGLGGLGLYGYRGYYPGYAGLYAPSLYPYYGGSYLWPGPASFGYVPRVTPYGSYFRPYVTTSQFVYTPTYVNPPYVIGGAPYGAVCGLYGYSAVCGCGY